MNLYVFSTLTLYLKSLSTVKCASLQGVRDAAGAAASDVKAG